MAEQYPGADLIDPLTMPALLIRQSALGARVLIRGEDLLLSYAQAPAFAARAARRLSELGVRRGDRVCVMLPNGRRLLSTWFGCAWMGAVFVPLNTALRGPGLAHALRTARPKIIIVDDEHRPHLESAGGALDADVPVFDRKVLDFSEQTEELPLSRLADGDPIALLFTSGTTGPSKAVICPQAQFYWWGELTGRAIGLSADDVSYTALPQFHTNALNSLHQAIVYGATWCYGQRFSASSWWRECVEMQATVIYLLGTMAEILLRRPESEYASNHQVHSCLSPGTAGGSVTRFAERFGVKIVDGYGSTETNILLSNSTEAYEPGCMGRPLPEFELRVADQNDAPLPRGEPGELLVRAKEPFSMASGYFGNDAATVKAWRNLWFHTGDTVREDENGLFHFLGRAKDAIRRRGENISAFEVEQVLLEHEDVVEVAVTGVASELGEEEVMAWVSRRAGATLSEQQLSDFAAPNIAAFALPRYVCFIDEFPKTENGKIRKQALRERGLPDGCWDRSTA